MTGRRIVAVGLALVLTVAAVVVLLVAVWIAKVQDRLDRERGS